jgi:hypothetical protein
MWVDKCYRFANRAAFLAACDAAGWPRNAEGQPWPAAVALDIIGPGVEPPAIVDGAAVPGAVLPGYFVNASWYSGTDETPEFAAAQIVAEVPLRQFAARDQQALRQRFVAEYEQVKGRRGNDPRLLDRVRRLDAGYQAAEPPERLR